MFADGRSKKVVFIAHCLLNQNAISDGTAVFPAAFRDIIQTFWMQRLGLSRCPVRNFAVWDLTGETAVVPAVPLQKKTRGSEGRWGQTVPVKS